jgi:hypothetical protein
MANLITKKTILDGERVYILELQITGDGTGDETATQIVDFSTLNNPKDIGYTKLALKKFYADLTGFSATLLWDATVDTLFQTLVEGDSGVDYSVIGGPIQNDAGAGVTGDVNLSTVGLGSGDVGTIRLEFYKKQ